MWWYWFWIGFCFILYVIGLIEDIKRDEGDSMKAYYLLMGIMWSAMGIVTMSVWVCGLMGLVDLEMVEKIFYPFMFTLFLLVGVSCFLDFKDKE